MQVHNITQVVGKLGLGGLYDIKPMERKQRALVVKGFIDASRQWDIRIRKTLEYTDPDIIKQGPMTRHIKAAKKGRIDVPMRTKYERRNPRAPHTSAKPVTTIQTFEAGKIYTFGTQLACMLLNPDHWGQVFEEVAQPVQPKNPLGIKSRKDKGEPAYEHEHDAAPTEGGIGPV